MAQREIRRAHIEGLLACYKILDSDVIDPETLIAVFELPPELVIEGFDAAECQGLVQHVRGSMYELTEAGEEQLEEVVFRTAAPV